MTPAEEPTAFGSPTRTRNAVVVAERDVFDVETWVFGGADARTRRHAVVVHVTSHPPATVTVYARSANPHASGVRTPASPSEGTPTPGTYAYLRTADLATFVEHAERTGEVDDVTFDALLELFRGRP